jgi:hypothetical protein
MSADYTVPEPPVSPPNWELPNVREVTIREGSAEPPRLEHFQSSIPAVRVAIEFDVALDGSIPGRALPAVLFIGDVPVFPQRIDPYTNHIVFQATRLDQLKEGEEIKFGWLDDPPELRKPVGLRYRR